LLRHLVLLLHGNLLRIHARVGLLLRTQSLHLRLLRAQRWRLLFETSGRQTTLVLATLRHPLRLPHELLLHLILLLPQFHRLELLRVLLLVHC
jgi:hypothetical protein